MTEPMDILIVDDSAAIRKILQKVLSQSNLPFGAILEAVDGLEAIERLREKKVGIVLSDINMPNMDGLALLTEMRAHPVWKSIPVIIVSTEASQQRVMEAVELGAAGYVRKPFTVDQIKDKIASLLAGG